VQRSSACRRVDDYIERKSVVLRHFRHYLRLGRYWKEAFRGRTLGQITPADIESYVARRVRNAAPATVNRELAFLKRIYNDAIANRRAEANPVRAVRMFKENNARVRFLAEEEVTQLQAAMSEDSWSLVALALHTGLRQAEQFNLRCEHVDFGTGLITIPRSKHGEVRRVPMNDTVRGILLHLPSRAKSALVFPSRTGRTPMKADNFVLRAFKPALHRAGIANFRWHDLRHTFASRLVMKGVDLRTVQELMGHKTITMTLRYSHLSPQHQLEAVQRLNPTGTRTDTSLAPASRESQKPLEILEAASGFEPLNGGFAVRLPAALRGSIWADLA